MNRIYWFGWVCLFVVLAGCAQNKFRRTSAEAYYEAAQKALRNGKCFDADLLFRNMLSDFPGSHLVDDAQFGLGEANRCKKEYVTAIFEYERLLNEYPVSPHVDAARFQIGECYFQESRGIHHDQKETQDAIREYGRFIEDFPGSELVPQADARIQELRNRMALKDVMIAEDYLKWNYFLSAQLYAETVLDKHPNTEAAKRAQFVVAQAKAKTGQFEAALDILTLMAGDSLPPELKKDVIDETVSVQEEIAKRQASQKTETVPKQ